MSIQAFRSNTQALIIAKALMRDKILQLPYIMRMLNRYLASFNLSARVASGELSPNEALIIFERAIHTFARKLHYELDKQWMIRQPDLNDLSNPLNVELALQNPNSIASQIMNDTAIAIRNAINEETFQNEQTYLQNLQNEEEENNNNNIIESSEINTTLENKNASAQHSDIKAIIIFDEKGGILARNAIESAFFERTNIHTEFHDVADKVVEVSLLEKILKPTPKDTRNDDAKK